MSFNDLTKCLDRMHERGLPGVDCAVTLGHETVYRHFAGYSDREAATPMDGSERFFLYSATKIFTCAAALQLFEQGKFLLTDPLYEYIPEYRDMLVKTWFPNNTYVLTPAREPIRIHHLFSMTAGMDTGRSAPFIEKLRRETGGRTPTVEYVRAMAGEPLHYEPGTRHSYGLAHDVLGALIEVISGQRFGEYLREHIFEPLGMERTSFDHSEEALRDVMAQYLRTPEGEYKRVPLTAAFMCGTEYESGGAGLFSCVSDYIRLTEALANGGVGRTGERILSANTIDLMRMNRLSGAALEDFGIHNLPGYGYGLGVRTLMDPVAAGSNSPVGEFGWSGAAGAYVLIDPKNRLSMFFATHVLNNIDDRPMHAKLRNTLYGCL